MRSFEHTHTHVHFLDFSSCCDLQASWAFLPNAEQEKNKTAIIFESLYFLGGDVRREWQLLMARWRSMSSYPPVDTIEEHGLVIDRASLLSNAGCSSPNDFRTGSLFVYQAQQSSFVGDFLFQLRGSQTSLSCDRIWSNPFVSRTSQRALGSKLHTTAQPALTDSRMSSPHHHPLRPRLAPATSAFFDRQRKRLC
jgi:hypothetical protein